MSQISNLSSADLKKAAAIQSQIETLQADLARILGNRQSLKAAPAKTGRRKMSAAARKKLSAAAKVRWKKAKAAGKTRL
jgi:hypothetical protein